MKVDMSPQAIENRLKLVGELTKFSEFKTETKEYKGGN